MPQLQVVVGELGLYLRPRRTRLNPRAPGVFVHLEHAVHLPGVQRDDAGVAVAVALDAGDDARPAAVRHDRHALLCGPRDDRLDVGLVARSRDQVRRGCEVAVEPPDDVPVALPVGVARPGAPLGRDDVGQLVGDG